MTVPFRFACVLVLALVSLAASAEADTLEVGPGRAYATPCDAVAAAQPNDVISIAAGTYTDSCAIDVAGLVLRGESGGAQPKIDLSGTDHPAQYKGIYVVTAADVTIENLELTGAHISDANGTNAAGIRVEAPGLTVRGCNIHDNQNGILGGTIGTLTVEHSEFFRNAVGDGCNQGGCTHNLYVANIDTLNFRFNWSHGLATDTADKGHLLKSRAKQNFILYNRLTGEDGFDSYELNFPNGGLVVAIGNQVQKGDQAGNGTMLAWGEEGLSNPDARVFLSHNTFVSELGSGSLLNVSGATLTAHNNVFVGGNSIGGGTLSADNWVSGDPLFVDRAQLDYRVQDVSPVVGMAVAPGMADALSLTPVSEYAHPLGERPRANADDLGAFEHDTDLSGTPTDAAVPGEMQDASAGGAADASSAADAANGGGGSGGAGGDGDAASTGASDAGITMAGGRHKPGGDGCSCAVPGAVPGTAGTSHPLVWLALAACLVAWQRLRRRRARVSLALLILCASCADRGAGPGDDAGASASQEDAGTGRDAAADASSAPDAAGPEHDASSVADSGADSGATAPLGGEKLCAELGWCVLPDTTLASVCADSTEYAEIQGYEGCAAVINDWSGGIADTRRNRLLLWGGGHHGYFGNELYALDLGIGEMQRLDDPSALTGVDLNDCASPESYADGRPSSRHTYDGLTYLANSDQMYAFSGAGIPCGYAVGDTWTLDLADLSWTNKHPDPYPKAGFGVVSDYDPNTKKVILDDGYSLWSYDAASNSYALLNDSDATNAHIDYHMTGRVDPKRKLFVVFGGGGSDGGGLQVFDLAAGSDYAQQDWTDQVTGCDALLAASSPGLAYDTKQEQLIGWAGGDDVYSFDSDAKTCTKVTYPGGPGPQRETGTFGRFRYFPAFNVFAVVNAHDTDAFTLRLTE